MEQLQTDYITSCCANTHLLYQVITFVWETNHPTQPGAAYVNCYCHTWRLALNFVRLSWIIYQAWLVTWFVAHISCLHEYRYLFIE